jgi:hypothetical protein
MRTLALLLATATTAQAQLLPPPQYDHEFPAQLTVETVATQAELARICPNAAARTPNMIGCAIRANDGSSCRIILVPDSIIQALHSTRSRILRHEIGHCNGWPADHPRGR